ncbi:MAG: hypothetical protein Q9212_007224 [Teloschistes hypoglaucus]
MASDVGSSHIATVSGTYRSTPQTARQSDEEVEKYWRSTVTQQPIPKDLRSLVREDLKEAWHFHRINYVHHFRARLEWGGTDSERLVLDDAAAQLTENSVTRCCNKPTAFYWLQSAQGTNNRGEKVFPHGIIYATIFQEWLRCHHDRPDVNSQHFFANPIRITAVGPSTVRGIIDAHRSVCVQVSNVIRQAGGRADSFVQELPSGLSRHYSLFALYRALVTIIDHTWYAREPEPDGMLSLGRVAQNQTVLIARTGIEADLSAPMSFDSIKAQSFPIKLCDAIGPEDDVIRVSLATAVRFIVDLETREKLAKSHTTITSHHDFCLDPPGPEGYRDDRQVCSHPDAWADASVISADEHGYDNDIDT